MEPAAPADDEAPPINRLNLNSILLVDDDKQLASALQWILADENFLVDLAFDGEEALLKMEEGEYDAVVCDLMMPRVRGDELYFRTKQIRPALSGRFIFITGFAANPAVNAFLTSHDLPYLVKPFRMEELIGCVKQLLAPGCRA